MRFVASQMDDDEGKSRVSTANDECDEFEWSGVENRKDLAHRLRKDADDVELGRLDLGDRSIDVPDSLTLKMELEAKEHRREIELEIEVSWSMGA